MTKTTEISPEDLNLAAQALENGLADVSKSAPVAEDAKQDTNDKADAEAKVTEKAAPVEEEQQDVTKAPEAPVEKSVTLTEGQLDTLLARAVEAGIAQAAGTLGERLEAVTKGLEVLDEKVTASMRHQAASTAVLTQFKDVTENLVEVTKSVKVDVAETKAEVELIGDLPAGRKSADAEVTVSKSADVTPQIDLEKLREVTKGLEVHEFVTLKKQVQRGDYSGLSALQKRELGLTQ